MAHITDLGFTLLELKSAVDAGDVRWQVHPDHPSLEIYNYTEEVQYRNKWNKITLACRGLIIDVDTGEVIARPWEKFFNFGQMDNRIDSMAPVEVTDKVDGSLGILYPLPDAGFAIATRGSFASEQALHATDLFNIWYYDQIYVGSALELTFLFEIVYPENRIVVNYGEMDDLVLLGAVQKRLGYYVGPEEAKALLNWTGPVTEVWQYDHFVDALSFPDRPGKEGVVIRSGTNIVKLKQADYVELHRIVTNMSPRTIWEMLSRGETIDSIAAPLPDEFHSYVKDIGENLEKQFTDIKAKAAGTFFGICADLGGYFGGEVPFTRKKFAEHAKRYPDIASLLFLLLDDRPVDESIWKMIKPRGDVKSLVSDEGE